jgi:hypothetical protein
MGKSEKMPRDDREEINLNKKKPMIIMWKEFTTMKDASSLKGCLKCP